MGFLAPGRTDINASLPCEPGVRDILPGSNVRHDNKPGRNRHTPELDSTPVLRNRRAQRRNKLVQLHNRRVPERNMVLRPWRHQPSCHPQRCQRLPHQGAPKRLSKHRKPPSRSLQPQSIFYRCSSLPPCHAFGNFSLQLQPHD